MSESILRTRHSARSFQDKPVEESVIREIIADAALAPSWCNSQPWKAYVLTGEAAKKMVQAHHDKHLNGTKAWADIEPPQLLPVSWTEEHWANIMEFWTVADCLPDGNDSLGLIDGCTWDFHSPAIVYITIPKISTFYGAYDAGAFGYGVCLAAHERGLSCIPAYEFVRFPQEVREVADIPDDEAIFMGIGMGYADDAELNQVSIRNSRVPLDNILKVVSE